MEDLIETAEKNALIEIVKLIQKRGMKGTKGDWKEFLNHHDKKFGSCLSDPSRRSNGVLIAFLKTFEEEDHTKFLAKLMQSYSKRSMVQQFVKCSETESPEQRLVRLTLEHQLYPIEYSFPSDGPDWVITKPGKKSEVMSSDNIIAVDCEMVLCEDGTEALVRVCVVDRNLQVKLDKLVKPNKVVTDYRTEITGVAAEDLVGVTCSLAEIQKSMEKLLKKGSILVGHGLSNDLNALKIDHAWVVDTSYVFRYSDVPLNKRPSLNNLCKLLLGYELRKIGEPHNCLDDACAAMKLVIAKLEQKVGDSISFAEVDVSEAEKSKLLIHRIPKNVSTEELLNIMSGDYTVEVKTSWRAQADKYSAYAVFKSSEEAKRAYKSVKGNKEKDTLGRHQKLVTHRLSSGNTCKLYIRKMTFKIQSEGVSSDNNNKRPAQVEDPPIVSKKRKTEKKKGKRK